MPVFQRKTILTAAVSTIVVALLAWATIPTTKAPTVDLATELPQGALLTLATPDFGSLLHSWNASPQQAAWLKSSNYSAFANSRLFGRLNDALAEFSTTANSTLDADFLQQVAGKESIFAWYDIGNLEFVYITHLPAGQAAKISLLQQRGKYSRREAGGTAFYVRQTSRSTAAPGDADPSGDAANGPSQPRTVAFAVRGDWLVLATREDLMAGALTLMQAQGNAATTPPASQATESWYAATAAAAPPQHGDLHMILDLRRIVVTPYFRTYWVQQNITATKRFASAAVDLYRDPTGFREERVLLPATASESSPTPPAAAQPVDLAPLESLVPARAGVYRIVANPSAADALSTLQDKLLTRAVTTSATSNVAPAADLGTPRAGSDTDFESRIDTPDAVAADPASAAAPLLAALNAANLDAILSVDRTDPPAPGTLFIAVHSAVILRSATPWNAPQLSAALLTDLRAQLTAGGIGAAWKTVATPQGSMLVMSDAQPFALFIDGNLAILASDPAMLQDILQARSKAAIVPSTQATLIAGFRHQQERPAFARLAAAIDTDTSAASTADATPTFLNGNIRSLSDSFAALDTERLIESHDGANVHQTVIYQWQPQ